MIRLQRMSGYVAHLGTIPKVLMVVAVSALIAGGLQLVFGAESQVVASAAAFSDRFIVDSAGPGCSHQNWPYYEPRCLRLPDGQHPRHAVRIVRMGETPRD